MNGTALLLGDLGDTGEPFVGIGVGVREWDAERAVVDVPVVEMFDEGRLVRGANLGQVNLVVHDDFHDGTASRTSDLAARFGAVREWLDVIV